MFWEWLLSSVFYVKCWKVHCEVKWTIFLIIEITIDQMFDLTTLLMVSEVLMGVVVLMGEVVLVDAMVLMGEVVLVDA